MIQVLTYGTEGIFQMVQYTQRAPREQTTLFTDYGTKWALTSLTKENSIQHPMDGTLLHRIGE